MQEITKVLKLPTLKYYETHLSLINCVLPKKMTPREIEIVASFMALRGDLAKYRFGPSARRYIREQLTLSHAGLSNFMGTLAEKGFLIGEGDTTTLLPLLVPENGHQIYHFKLVNSEDA